MNPLIPQVLRKGRQFLPRHVSPVVLNLSSPVISHEWGKNRAVITTNVAYPLLFVTQILGHALMLSLCLRSFFCMCSSFFFLSFFIFFIFLTSSLERGLPPFAMIISLKQAILFYLVTISKQMHRRTNILQHFYMFGIFSKCSQVNY